MFIDHIIKSFVWPYKIYSYLIKCMIDSPTLSVLPTIPLVTFSYVLWPQIFVSLCMEPPWVRMSMSKNITWSEVLIPLSFTYASLVLLFHLFGCDDPDHQDYCRVIFTNSFIKHGTNLHLRLENHGENLRYHVLVLALPSHVVILSQSWAKIKL